MEFHLDRKSGWVDCKMACSWPNFSLNLEELLYGNKGSGKFLIWVLPPLFWKKFFQTSSRFFNVKNGIKQINSFFLSINLKFDYKAFTQKESQLFHVDNLTLQNILKKLPQMNPQINLICNPTLKFNYIQKFI